MVNGKGQAASKTGRVKNELIYIVAAALLNEFMRHCKPSVVEYVLKPMIKRQLGTRLRLGNLVIKTTKGGLNADELHKHMHELMSTAPWLDVVYGIITNGAEAEYYVFKRGGKPELKAKGGLREVAAAAAADLCAGKIPVVSPEDVADIFGI